MDRSLGVLVMRVQVDDLHEGHYDTIKEVIDRHDRTLILIGLSQNKCTVNNPLDYDTRRRMILEHFPQVMVGYIEDVYSDEIWSEKLDTIIAAKAKNDDVFLYGSRDSFIPHYHGKYVTESLEQRVIISGTQIRKNLALQSRSTKDFRAGAIWYALNQYPQAIPTVDIAVIGSLLGNPHDLDSVLLGKKPGEDKWRLIGGFVQPGETYEAAAVRELREETGVEALDLNPCKSFFVDDWRYKSEVNKITTFLYTVTKWEGRICPDDDIEALAWLPLDDDLKDKVVPVHREMIEWLVSGAKCKNYLEG